MEKTEKIQYKYEIEPTPVILFLMYLSHVYRLDLETLLLLYDRIGEDVFFVFYMFSGKSFIMPKCSKMFKINHFMEEICKSFELGEDIVCKTNQDNSFVCFLNSVFNRDSGKITIEFEIPIHKSEEKEEVEDCFLSKDVINDIESDGDFFSD